MEPYEGNKEDVPHFLSLFMVGAEVWGDALSWCKIKFLPDHSSGHFFWMHSLSFESVLMYVSDLTVSPGAKNSIMTMPLQSKNAVIMVFLTDADLAFLSRVGPEGIQA